MMKGRPADEARALRHLFTEGPSRRVAVEGETTSAGKPRYRSTTSRDPEDVAAFSKWLSSAPPKDVKTVAGWLASLKPKDIEAAGELIANRTLEEIKALGTALSHTPRTAIRRKKVEMIAVEISRKPVKPDESIRAMCGELTSPLKPELLEHLLHEGTPIELHFTHIGAGDLQRGLIKRGGHL